MHYHYRESLRNAPITWRFTISDGTRLLTSVSHGATERNLKALAGEGRMLTQNALPLACHNDEACDWSVMHFPEDFTGRTGSGSGNDYLFWVRRVVSHIAPSLHCETFQTRSLGGFLIPPDACVDSL